MRSLVLWRFNPICLLGQPLCTWFFRIWSAGVPNLQVLTLFNDRPFFIEPSIVQVTH